MSVAMTVQTRSGPGPQRAAGSLRVGKLSATGAVDCREEVLRRLPGTGAALGLLVGLSPHLRRASGSRLPATGGVRDDPGRAAGRVLAVELVTPHSHSSRHRGALDTAQDLIGGRIGTVRTVLGLQNLQAPGEVPRLDQGAHARDAALLGSME